MRDIDKNDVDISQLFKWSKPVEITDTLADQSVTLYVRLVGDADLNRARTEALRSSGQLRKNLKTLDSDERVSFMSDIDEAKDKDTLIAYCVILHLEGLQRQAVSNVDVPRPKEPKSDASLEKQEAYQKAVDKYPTKFGKAVAKEVEKLRKKEQKRMEALTKEEVFDEYESLLINRLCHQEMVSEYYDQITFYATYSDPEFTIKTFPTYEDFDNVAPQVKLTLTEAYKSLELGIDVVKKSPEAQE